jgi:transcriptional regulator with XRE-family HTH domain
MLPQLVRDKMKEGNGLSVRAAARQIGVAHTTLGRFLQGQQIDLDTLEAISKWVGVDPSTALDADQEASPLEKKIAVLLQADPRLERIFTEAVDRIASGQATPELLEDLVEYAAYKLNVPKDGNPT